MLACDVLPCSTSPASTLITCDYEEVGVSTAKRKLAIGLIGIAILLVSILVYAQFNASRNYDLHAYPPATEETPAD